MNNKRYIKKSFSKIGFVILVLFAAFLFHNEASAQKKLEPLTKNAVKTINADNAAKKIDNIKIAPETVLLTDTLKFDAKTQGILNKILLPIKFRANRNRTEQKRIYDFMLDLIKSKELDIDSTTVNEIMIQLDTINSTSTMNKKSIEAIIESYSLYKKTSKEVVDSLKTQMSAVIQENATANNQEKRDLKTKVSEYLQKIKSVRYSRASGLALRDTIVRRDTAKKVDTLLYREISLEPKIKIIGWYNQWMKDQYLHFNYNYLSAINLYGYNMSATGECANPNDIKKFENPGGIIDYTKNNSCEVYLTIFNKMPEEISKFLNSKTAPNTLVRNIDSLITSDHLNGINIYFDYLKTTDADRFVQFISNLRQNLKGIDPAIRLNVTIPPVRDDKTLAQTNAYKFSLLNPLVDYYFVLTDSIINSNQGIAQSASPLFSSDKYGPHSIEQTIGFYTTSKIPPSKLILTVSYSGLSWQVKDFSGDQSPNSYKAIKYSDIVKNYLTQKVPGRTVIQGFDPDQVSAYLNVTGKAPAPKVQIWYDNIRSLFLKYNWALENRLGGVSIRGLGYDDGYSEFWDVLGATLIKIDTVIVGKKPLKVILPPIKLSDYLKIFIADFEWAVVSDLEYRTQKKDSTCNCVYNEDSIKKYTSSPLLWREWQPYNSKATNKDTGNVLDSSLQCKCLFARWDVYASIFLWCWIISLASVVLLYVVSGYFERYKRGGDNAGNIVKIAQSILFIIFIFAISFWLYLSPSVALIGASSSGSNIGVLFIALFFGVFLGWIMNSWYNKNKRVPKNLP